MILRLCNFIITLCVLIMFPKVFGGTSDVLVNINSYNKDQVRIKLIKKTELPENANLYLRSVSVDEESLQEVKLINQKKSRVNFESLQEVNLNPGPVLVLQKDLVGKYVPLFFSVYKKSKQNRILVKKPKKLRLIRETKYYFTQKWEAPFEGAIPVSLEKIKGRSAILKVPNNKFGRAPVILKVEDDSIKVPDVVPEPSPTPLPVSAPPVEQVEAKESLLDRFSVTGYIKLDMIHSNKSSGGVGGANIADQLFIPRLIPTNASEFERNEFTIHGRQSRLHVKYSKDDFTAGLEIDSFGSNLSGAEIANHTHGLSARLAYGVYKGVLVGLYHSNLFVGHAYPETLDFAGPVGKIIKRQPQIRVTFIDQEAIKISASLESPESIFSSSAGRLIPDDDALPDFTIKLENRYLSIAGAVRQLAIREPGKTKYKNTYGGLMAGKIPLGVDDIRYWLVYGSIDAYSDFSLFTDGVATDDGRLSPNEQLTGSLAYRRVWSDKWWSNFVYGYGSLLTQENTKLFAPDETKYATSMHINNIFKIDDHMTFGFEYLNGFKYQFDGNKGRLERYQFSIKYVFH